MIAGGRSRKLVGGVWSATPTPLTEDMKVDGESIQRLVEHHLKLGVRGLLVCGTCGEGPWLTDAQRRQMAAGTARHARGRLTVAAQVTDNSAARALDNVRMMADCGVDVAAVAQPYMLMNATPRRILDFYAEIADRSPLPVAFYDRGKISSVFVPDGVLRKVSALDGVVMIKDSSVDPNRRKIALAARRRRPDLLLLNGYEFDCVTYLKAGYDGLLLGGGIFNAYLANRIVEAVAARDFPQAEKLQARMNRIMWAVYGGRKIRCWMGGLKHLCVELGIFRTSTQILQYPLTESCRKAIRRVLETDSDVIFA